jgi:hypothetical protein
MYPDVSEGPSQGWGLQDFARQTGHS